MDTVTLIDYGGSNLRSAHKALEAIGARVQVTDRPVDILRAVKLVLPGVGAFGAGMANLHERDLAGPILEAVANGVPFLGICVGMQFLFDVSEEMGSHAGLGLVPGRVRRFPAANGLKVPHMGWNQVDHDGQNPLLVGVPNGAYVYFVHSYFCVPDDPADVVATTDYGAPFAAVIQRGNVFGTQFHPEKSQQAGQRLLRNFVQL